jgi:hypothetical protein
MMSERLRKINSTHQNCFSICKILTGYAAASYIWQNLNTTNVIIVRVFWLFISLIALYKANGQRLIENKV